MAIVGGNLRKVEQCLYSGVSADAKFNCSGDSSFSSLAQRWESFVGKRGSYFIYGNGAASGVPALCLAVSHGNVKVVELLASHCLLIDAPTSRGLSALQLAIFMGNREIASILMRHGADINRPLPNGVTLVDCLDWERYTLKELHVWFSLFVQNGLNPDGVKFTFTMDEEMRTDAVNAVDRSFTENLNPDVAAAVHHTIEANSNHFKKLLPAKLELSLLHFAVKAQWSDVVEELCERGATIDSEGNFPGTPMHSACSNGNVRILRTLLEHGGRLDATTNQQWTLLHRASFNGHEEVVRELIERGIDLNARTNFGGTALHLAVSRNEVPIVKILIDSGAYIDIRNNDGMTPLALALGLGQLDTVRFLLEKGASISGFTSEGYPYAILSRVKADIWEYVRDPEPTLAPTPEQRDMAAFLKERAAKVKDDPELLFQIRYISALLGDRPAMRELAAYYKNGVGCNISLDHARFWEKRARRR